MYELIYGSQEIQSIIKEEYPDAVFKDASDFIHPDRFEVNFDDNSEKFEDRFYVFAIKKEFAYCCFGFRLLLMQLHPTDEHKARVKRILDMSEQEEEKGVKSESETGR